MNIKTLTSTARAVIVKRSPEILVALGITGMITACVMSVRATPKALELIECEQAERKAELDKKEIVQTCWRCYIPAVVVGGVSVACLIGASSVNLKRNAALATAYTLSETAFKEYQEKALEQLGERKEKAIREAVSKDMIETHPNTGTVVYTTSGNALCYDAISGRYFKSDIEMLRRAENELNRRMRDDMCVTLNEFYDEIGLEHIKLGDYLGWHIDKEYVSLDFSSHLDSNGTPCLVVDYKVVPVFDMRY